MPRSPEITHKIMSAVKSKDTRPELTLRHALWAKGYRYRVNVKTMPGKPDIVFSRAKVAVFCDGDFWHGNNWVIRGYGSLEKELSRYSSFWRNKILGNIERDNRNNVQLENAGWTVVRLWESSIKNDINSCLGIVEKAINSKNCST